MVEQPAHRPAPDQARQSSTSLTCSAAWMWIGPPAASAMTSASSAGVTARRVCGATPIVALGPPATPAVVDEPREAVEIVDEPPLLRPRRRAAEIRVRVEDRQQRQADAGRRAPRRRCASAISADRGVGRAVRRVVQIVEFADAGEARLQHLDIGLRGDRLDLVGRHRQREAVHRLAPGPETVGAGAAMLGQARHGALEGVAVQVGDAGHGDRVALVAVARRRARPRPRRSRRLRSSSRTSARQPSGVSALAAWMTLSRRCISVIVPAHAGSLRVQRLRPCRLCLYIIGAMSRKRCMNGRTRDLDREPASGDRPVAQRAASPRSRRTAPGLGVDRARRGRGPRRAHRLRRAGGDMPAALRARGDVDRLRGPLDHARADRLPHPSRLRRRPGAGIRAAARRRDLRGDRARRRRHPLDRARDARSERGRPRRAQTLPRLDALIAEGVTTIEIKSGYGLDLETERKIAARRAPARAGMRPVAVRTTFLGAHALPPECDGRPRGLYRRCRATTMLPALAAEGLADAVDAFCESIAFSPRRDRARVRRAPGASACRSSCMPTSSPTCSGAALAAEFGALSADHLEYTDEAGVAAMARAGTVAVLLPGAFYFLRETQGAAGRRSAPARRARWRSRPTATPAPRR